MGDTITKNEDPSVPFLQRVQMSLNNILFYLVLVEGAVECRVAVECDMKYQLRWLVRQCRSKLLKCLKIFVKSVSFLFDEYLLLGWFYITISPYTTQTLNFKNELMLHFEIALSSTFCIVTKSF